MDPQQLETLNSFLSQVEQDSLFSYLGLSVEASNKEVSAAIKKKRSWAQGQQSNPKYRSEAIWYIKNISLIKRFLLDERTAYVQHLRMERHRASLRTLSVYILGAMAGGELTQRAEEAIRERGTKLGLPENLVSQQIERLLADQGARREAVAPPPRPEPEPEPLPTAEPELPSFASNPDEPRGFVDYYAVLGVSPESSTQELESAYRSRYRQVGRLDSPTRARMLYAELDEAWHHLRDPLRRTTYDKTRRRALQDDFDGPPPDTDFGRPLIEDSIEDNPTSDIPRPPNGLAQRAYQPGQQPRTPPRLEIDGPAELSVSVGSTPHRVSLTVRNGGSGRMAGRIHADRPWVTPSPARLDPMLKQQTVELVIDPTRMPRRKGQSRVTISTRTAGNRSVMLQVKRSTRLLPYLLIGGAVLAVGAAAYGFLGNLPTEATSKTGRLVVNVDPPVGEIYLNDTLINTQGALDTEAGFPLDTPFEVRVQADGFAEWTKTITVTTGKTVTLAAELELTDPMTFTPQDEWEEGGLNSGALQRELIEHTASFERCFQGATVGEPGYTAILKTRGYINQLGAIARVDFLERNFDAPEIDHCLRRQFRGLSLPLLNPRFDYATFDYTFDYTVPSTTD